MIEEIVEQDLCAKAERLGEYLASRLGCLKKLGVVREIRGKGVLRGVELTCPNLGNALKKTALKNGIILRIDPSWFAVSPPLIAEEADIDEMCHLIEKSLTDALEMTMNADANGRNRTVRHHTVTRHTSGRVGRADTSARHWSRHAFSCNGAGAWPTAKSRSPFSMRMRSASTGSGRIESWTRRRRSPAFRATGFASPAPTRIRVRTRSGSPPSAKGWTWSSAIWMLLPLRIASAVWQAQQNLKPVRVAAGKGTCDINVNRRFRAPDGSMVVGRNWNGAADRTVRVIRFDDLEENPSRDHSALRLSRHHHGVADGTLYTGFSGPGTPGRGE